MFVSIDCSNYTFEYVAIVEVYDITGNIINNVKSSVNGDKIILEKTEFVPGLYLYKVYDGAAMIGTGRIIV